MEIKTVNDLMTDQNCYFIINEEKNEAVVIDPGSRKAIDFYNSFDGKVVAILLTHCHYDHVCFAEELKDLTGAPVICTKECIENLKSERVNVSAMFGDSKSYTFADKSADDGEVLSYAGILIKVIKTKGHTSCSACFMIEDRLFSGDTLFKRTCGRWDLATGDGEEIKKSIREKLFSLDEDTIVYPGHGDITTIGYEKKFNLVV